MKILSSVFFFKWSFIDFGSHIRSVIPFELIFEYGVRSGSKFILVSPPFTDMIILSLLNWMENILQNKLEKSQMEAPGDSDSKKSDCNARDQGSTPGSGRSPGEAKCYPLQYSSIAWRITWTEYPGRLQSMGLLRVRQNWVTFTYTLQPSLPPKGSLDIWAQAHVNFKAKLKIEIQGKEF